MGDRAGRLTKVFKETIAGKAPVNPKNANLFLEAVTKRNDAAGCVSELIASSAGLESLHSALCSKLDAAFLNDRATDVLEYFQHPSLINIGGGTVLAQVLLKMVDPPYFWNALRDQLLAHNLKERAHKSFAWLILQLISLPGEEGVPYREIAKDAKVLEILASSSSADARNLAAKIKHVVAAFDTGFQADDDYAPGGRHDNDFVDFRQISILPTADEVISSEKAFLRPVSVIDDPESEPSRVGMYLDNQFRLLREDMIYDMRDELQIALGKKKGVHRGLVIDGLRPIDIFRSSEDKRASLWGIQMECLHDLWIFKKIDPKDKKKRKQLLQDTATRKILRHQSLTCLIVDGEVVAFPTIHRDEDLLAMPLPNIILQLNGEASTRRALLRLKKAKQIKLLQIDTAIFSYEPVLKALQDIRDLPLSEELLFWKPGKAVGLLSTVADNVVSALRYDPNQDLQPVINTAKSIKLDDSQAESLLAGLTQQVSLIQGPPGTGKSFIGSLLARIIHDSTSATILVVCYTNHALDQFLEDLLDIGIPQNALVRLGGKSTPRTEPLSVYHQKMTYKLGRSDWTLINDLKQKSDAEWSKLELLYKQYRLRWSDQDLMTHLEFEEPDFYDAFQVPEAEDGAVQVGRKGKAVGKFYLLNQWCRGWDAGTYKDHSLVADSADIWAMKPSERQAKLAIWVDAIVKQQIEEMSDIAKRYNRMQVQLERKYNENIGYVLKNKRIIGCTTTAAAKYSDDIRSASPGVLLVEEAGEILESHVITALGSNTSQIILIGDHQQLRPKVNSYELTVEKDMGYDLNRSLFERLVVKGYPHKTLSRQHRMRPEISALIRHLTYPDLVDAPSTHGRANLRGVRDNIVFINHAHPEDEQVKTLEERFDLSATSSKRNTFESQMVLKIVRYLALNGYGTDEVVVLTPYLGQLSKLREILKSENDVVLNDLDSFDLVRAGLMSADTANLSKKRLRLATIDNYQGEESDIVIISLTRSNPLNDIGFMFSPERLNVLLSRARNALIMIGNAKTFMHSKRGGALWTKFMEFIKSKGHLYDGLPTQCERHPSRKSLLKRPDDFDLECPEGGCTEPCGTILSCGLHQCDYKCHQLYDHSKIQCSAISSDICPNGHKRKWKCFRGAPLTCNECDKEAEAAAKKQQQAYEEQQKLEADRREHQRRLDELQAEIDQKAEELRRAQLAQERSQALELKKRDLDNLVARIDRLKNPPPPPNPQPSTSMGTDSKRKSRSRGKFKVKDNGSMQAQPAPTSNPSPPRPPSVASVTSSGETDLQDAPRSRTPAPAQRSSKDESDTESDDTMSISDTGSEASEDNSSSLSYQFDNANTGPPAAGDVIPPLKPSKAAAEWQRQKDVEGASDPSIDKVMGMIGLEDVKEQILAIKAKIETSKRQGVSVKKDRFNAVFLGNPGTGKTTIARLYSSFLIAFDVLPGNAFVETTGSLLANGGIAGAENHLKSIKAAGGGAMFIDEAYQLTSPHNHGGKSVLDYLLAEMENNVGTIIFILAGYNKEMESFFEHNPGLTSRLPYKLQFQDYDDAELLAILEKRVNEHYMERAALQDGMHGLFARIAVKRVGRGRGTPGFGNARALENAFSKIRERQAVRLTDARRKGQMPDDFMLLREDLIGPDPSSAILESKAWEKLQELTGLDSVKDSVRNMIDMIRLNFKRELQEKKLAQLSLNRVFFGNPGTGKTTVAKLYGQILADLGLLSNGEVVVKNPADFIGAHLGESEEKTKAILATTLGKVLVIDEAYMLYKGGGGDSMSHTDIFRTAVIDTLVAEVQSTPGEDRCVLLLGYRPQMLEMFQNVNPGLSRRFAIEDTFTFEDFTRDQLGQILDYKLKIQDLGATPDAKKVALDVLDRLRNRPNFGNAGEVENLISKAKGRFQAWQATVPPTRRTIDIVFEPADFDPDFDRQTRAADNLKALFADVVGCDAIVEKLAGYQKIASNLKKRGQDPRPEIPMNFVFKGPPGTGKTTTARKMGQVFCDMGFLASNEVVECSATDLVGSYVGHTGPKTRKLFEKALGKVLFVDEAYRLAQGHFAKEAIDEVVGLLTHEDFRYKQIVILAGYDQDINKLMAANAGLSSRFPEEIIFKNLTPSECLDVLQRQLMKKGIELGDLGNGSSLTHKEVLRLFERLVQVPSWGNARDVETLAKKISGEVYKFASDDDRLALDCPKTVNIVKSMLIEKQERTSNIPGSTHTLLDPFPQADLTGSSSPPPSANINTSNSALSKGKSKEGDKKESSPDDLEQNPVDDQDGRDSGVSDEIWWQMQVDIRAVEEAEKVFQQEMEKKKKDLFKAEQREKDAEKKEKSLVGTRINDDAELQALKKKQEEARLKRVKAQRERERIAIELERKRKEEEERKKKEALAQKKCREMGVCPMGFKWIKQSGGYRCAGGSHFISDAQLGI